MLKKFTTKNIGFNLLHCRYFSASHYINKEKTYQLFSTHLTLILSPYTNQSINLHHQTSIWYLYSRNSRLKRVNLLNTNPTKWSNTLKQFQLFECVWPFCGLALKGLKKLTFKSWSFRSWLIPNGGFILIEKQCFLWNFFSPVFLKAYFYHLCSVPHIIFAF